ncbi:hypothetical protein [Calothrix sp. NIES-2100]|uniref:hypothetical protein n=1 Tax=Calothrix sp. NIES-2100 TaxID=1954172 RepID=UPI0030D95884
MTHNPLKDPCPKCGSFNTMSKPLTLFSLICRTCGHDWLPEQRWEPKSDRTNK